MRSRILLFLASAILVPALSVAVILFAKGYRPNFTTRKIQPTGLLATSSVPENAQIWIDKILKSATPATLTLSPGTFEVEIKKDGYQPWKKRLTISPEIVTRASAILFPSVPSLKAITTTGATHPLLSPDGAKVAYLIPEKTTTEVYTLDLTESPLGLLNRDPKLVATLNIVSPSLVWSPNSQQILALADPVALLIDISSQTSTDVSISPPNFLPEPINLDLLPTILKDLLATSAADLVWSPKENKLMYMATASAVIPDGLIRPLPGSNTQQQTRRLSPNKIYIYDLEEDRNFVVGNKNDLLAWFPTSNHIIKTEPQKITIMEYDGQNPTVVYAGPMTETVSFPYPSGKQLLILTHLSSTPTKTPTLPNLYAVSVR